MRRDRPSGSSGGNTDRRNKRAVSATADIATTYVARKTIRLHRDRPAGDCYIADERLIRFRLRRNRPAGMLTEKTDALLLRMLILLLLLSERAIRLRRNRPDRPSGSYFEHLLMGRFLKSIC